MSLKRPQPPSVIAERLRRVAQWIDDHAPVGDSSQRSASMRARANTCLQAAGLLEPWISVGSVVQIDPRHDEAFGACFLVVTEMKSWGVHGYVTVPGHGDNGGSAFYRVAFEHVVYIGPSEWALESATKVGAVDPVGDKAERDSTPRVEE